jgi:hypothetical protein
MKKKSLSNTGPDISLPRPSTSDLRGKQSVRATFKLSERAISTISIVATHLGIKQKSLFDHLIEDIHSLGLIAERIQMDRFDKLDRIQKTFVLSRKTITCLGEASEKFATPRDALVEYSIQRLLPLIAEEREKHDKRKHVQVEISNYLRLGETLLQESGALLGKEDPVHQRLNSVITGLRSAHTDIRDFVEKGKKIEDF